MKKKIFVITGNRADYGLLKKLIFKLKKNKRFNLKVLVTGAHLIKKYGFTVKEIKDDGIKVDYKVDLSIRSDSPYDISKAVSNGVIKFSKILTKEKVDLAIVLGDRYEIFSFVISAAIHGIPIAHLHGGEITQGALDDAMRHSITKMSDLHFVANKIYKKRIIQLGENPEMVFDVGGLGVDEIDKKKLFSKMEIEKIKKFKFYKKNLLITYHPETIKNSLYKEDFGVILKSLLKLKKTRIIFTAPNSDAGNLKIYKKIEFFTKNNSNAVFFKSLGHQMYLSLINQVDAVIGNSSSGLSEVPYFKKPTINIGHRQKGRIIVDSIIDCSFNTKELDYNLKKIYNKHFQSKLKNVVSPYGKGGASKKIMKILENVNLKDIKYKKFKDLKF